MPATSPPSRPSGHLVPSTPPHPPARSTLRVENSTATKLDYYVRPSLNVQVDLTSNGDALVNTTVTVTNTTPSGLGPNYQTGPDGVNSFFPGQYVGRVVLWAPAGIDHAPEHSGIRFQAEPDSDQCPAATLSNDLVRHRHPPCGRKWPSHAPIRPAAPVEAHGFSASSSPRRAGT